MNLQALKDQLVRHEGLRLKVYNDSIGIPSIGVGRNLQDVGISHEEAMLMLENDVERVLTELDNQLPWWRQLSDIRQLVVADLAFNIGLQRLKGFRNALQAMQEARWDDAAKEMLDSLWARQVGPRALRLAQMMRTDMEAV